MRSPRRPLGRDFAQLEPRDLPSAFGIAWADPGHLTLSFAPDGTQTPGGPSTLTGTLGPGSTSQREILRAFQTWAAVTNVNVGLVPDGGQPLGSLGAVQGDRRFGDVRVTAAPLPSALVADASPFSWAGTTYGGDVILNSNFPFHAGSTANSYDVYSVAVHEAGHVLGLAHSTATGSVMNDSYAVRSGLSGADIAAVQALYGVRSPDANELNGGNNTPGTATALQPSGLAGRLVGNGDLTTPTDIDCFKFSVLPTLGLTTVTVRLQVQGLSLLTPRVTVLNAAGQTVTLGAKVDPLNNDVMLTFLNVTGGTYTVKVQGATGDVFGIGAYHLVVDTLNISLPLPLVSSLLAPVVDGHLNDALTAATDLGGSLGPKPDQRFDATFRGVIEDRSDVDYYKVRAPAAGSGTPLTLNALVWGIDAMPLGPRLRVFDANGKPVAFRVLANEGGLFSLDVGGVTPGAVYYLSVAARNPTGTSTTGAYFLGVDFNQVPRTTFDAVGSGNVSPSATLAGSIVVTDPSVFQFALAASAAQPGGTVTMTLTDSAGRVVFTLTSTAGQPLATTTRYLAAGRYTVQCTASGSGTNPVRFDLFILRLSFGVGPYKTKTTSSDTTAPTNDNGYTYDSSSAAQPSGYPYYF